MGMYSEKKKWPENEGKKTWRRQGETELWGFYCRWLNAELLHSDIRTVISFLIFTFYFIRTRYCSFAFMCICFLGSLVLIRIEWKAQVTWLINAYRERLMRIDRTWGWNFALIHWFRAFGDSSIMTKQYCKLGQAMREQCQEEYKLTRI